MRILFMLLLLPSVMMAQTKKIIDKKKSTITYSMNHMLHAWDGTSSDLNGVVVASPENKIQKVAVVSKVSAFDSKSSNRDAHMLEVTEALKFPNITFSSTSVTEGKNGELDIKGTLQFHGVNKEISFKGSTKGDGSSTNVTGEFIFLLEDFKIERPSFMLQKVDNEVKVKFDIYF
ncbi:MAG: YceI family protein [bacterium]|jgi:polyisoprenoid-binding protein YceI